MRNGEIGPDLPPAGSPARAKICDASLARIRIVAALIEPYRKTHRGKGTHEIDCPLCSGKIRFSIAGSNGHAMVQCTNRCVSWIE